MKRTVALVFLSAILAILSVVLGRRARVFRGASSIGYVSMQRILNESPQDKAGAARFQELQQQKTRELGDRQQALEATRATLRQSGPSSATHAQLERQEQQQRTDLERATAQAQTDLQAEQRQFQTELRSRLTPALEAVAKARNVQLILNEDNAVVWSSPGFDLTTDVIDRLKGAPSGRPAKP
jgi:outer membrane protein